MPHVTMGVETGYPISGSTISARNGLRNSCSAWNNVRSITMGSGASVGFHGARCALSRRSTS